MLNSDLITFIFTQHKVILCKGSDTSKDIICGSDKVNYVIVEPCCKSLKLAEDIGARTIPHSTYWREPDFGNKAL